MQHSSWRRCLRRGGLIRLPWMNPGFPIRPASTELTLPAWWLKGQPRKVFGSRAEVELLSQLAVLLMPGEPISKAFRDFPVKKCKEWGSSRLCPDFAAHGVLKAANAALFIEYDGHYRHMQAQGLATDIRKTSALLRFAPAGSVVVRIVHKERQSKDGSVQVLVDCWQAKHALSLRKTLQQVLDSLLLCCRHQLVPGLVSRLEACGHMPLDKRARAFAGDAALMGKSDNNGLDLREFLQKEVHLSAEQVAKMIATSPKVLGLSIEANLKPTVEWIKGLGLSQSQVAKMIAMSPQMLGLSIEANLKPTVEWIKGLGLSQSQVAKMIAMSPQVLGLSIEANLKPTVEWIKGLGLSQSQVAKVIATSPQVLGYSLEANLKPTVEWIKGLGLSQSQVAKVIATFPQVLGYSIEANLKPTVEWIKGLGLSQSQVVKMIATFPQVIGYSVEAKLKPTVEWFKRLGLSQSQVAKVIATSPQVLGYSLEANLKPTVEWIKGLGLSQSQVAKVIATFPQVLGYSIEANLKPTVEWIKGLGLSQSQVVKMIATFPQVIGYSVEAKLKPTVEWFKRLGLSQSQVAKMIAKFPKVLGYNIEANLKPTVEWIKELGVGPSQVANAVAAHPQILGYSIGSNLRLKHVLLQKFFPGAAAAQLLARAPRLWSYRHTRLEHRLHVLKCQGQLSKLAGAMTLGLDDFSLRFASSRLPSQKRLSEFRRASYGVYAGSRCCWPWAVAPPGVPQQTRGLDSSRFSGPSCFDWGLQQSRIWDLVLLRGALLRAEAVTGFSLGCWLLDCSRNALKQPIASRSPKPTHRLTSRCIVASC